MPPQLLVACDFDGTLTRQDTLVEILNRFGHSRWAEIQERVVAGEISIREGLQSEMGSVRATSEELQGLLSSRIQLDPTFPAFLQGMRRKGVPVVVLTGGFDFCVETVLRAAGLWPIPFLANRLIYKGTVHQGDAPLSGVSPCGLSPTWLVDFPYPSARCEACGHCKGDPIRDWVSRGYTTVFVGNGVTDRCAAQAAALTFAKDELYPWCKNQGIPAVDFQTFDDVQRELERREWV